jgi:uncharacterized protein (DUF927 family)
MLPVGFGMTANGLFYTDPDEDNAQPMWICQQFSVPGECEDGSGGGWGVVMSWRDEAEHPHTWIVPRELFHGEPHVIAATLEAHGLRCNYAKKAQASLRQVLESMRPEHRLQAVERGGWHCGAYVLPDGTVYGEGIILRPELRRHDLSCAMAGTVKDWQDQVARYAIGYSRVAFFIAAAFAGALLDIAGEQSGGFHQHGGSQIGKSTSAYAAASVIGKGARDGACHQWRATSNGLEGIASRCTDSCLVLDEIAQADAKDAGDAIYQLANEQGKQRADRYGAARPRANWRILFLSTGEVTLAQRMSAAGKQAMTGMEIRLVNIPADAGAGLGVFETLHGVSDAGTLADTIKHGAKHCYGAAGREFVARLAALRSNDADEVGELVCGLRSQFIAENVPAGSDGQVRSVAGRFGVVAAAGEMATEFGILSWPKGEATRAATRCFADWLAARGTNGAGEKQVALRQVRAFIEQHGASRFTEIRTATRAKFFSQGRMQAEEETKDQITELKTLNRCGWRKYDPETEQWKYLILPEAWRNEVCKGIDSDVAAKTLADLGWLERDGTRYKKRMHVPENGKPWVYVVSGDVLEGAGG